MCRENLTKNQFKVNNHWLKLMERLSKKKENNPMRDISDVSNLVKFDAREVFDGFNTHLLNPMQTENYHLAADSKLK